MPSPADPIAISLGGLAIRWYALFILAGIAVTILLSRRLARHRGLDPDFILDIAPWVVFSGIAGARIYYLLLRAGYYLEHPGDALNLRLGGLSIHGAIIAGALALYLLCRAKGQSFLRWVDIIVPGLALAQGIGRWGNWANQEAFGTPSTLPWAVEIESARRPAQFSEFATFHPTFLYESLFNLINAVVLTALFLRRPRWLRNGDLLAFYLLFYGLARLVIESIRTDSLYLGPLPAAYWLSMVAIGTGVALLIGLRIARPNSHSQIGSTGSPTPH
jgi:phosphatidylglycerol:prolipoprotein diacylglycerol transferase